jgi:hypothetical protein
MKKTILSVICFGFALASMANGAVPSITVMVSDASGKAAYKGSTDSKGTFGTSKLQKGNYTVQFSSKSSGLKGTYALVVSAGKKKVTADSVAGEKFAKGGVAMKIDVGDGLNITGQVTSGLESTTKVDKNGKKMVWIEKKTGSNLPGHWAAEDSAEAKEAMTSGTMSRGDLQNRMNQAKSPNQ